MRAKASRGESRLRREANRERGVHERFQPRRVEGPADLLELMGPTQVSEGAAVEILRDHDLGDVMEDHRRLPGSKIEPVTEGESVTVLRGNRGTFSTRTAREGEEESPR
jgi:hypothetical protein